MKLLSRVVISCAVAGLCSAAVEAQAPFAGWYRTDGVVTSNDEYSVDLYWDAEAGAVRLPGCTRPVDVAGTGPNDPRPLFTVTVGCRADGSAAGFSGPSPWRAELLIPLHPEAADVVNWWNPLFWFLGVLGQEQHRTPVKIGFAKRERWHSYLVRPRTDYSISRPSQTVKLDPVEVRAVLRSPRGTRLRGAGRGAEIELSFPTWPEVGALLDLMEQHCPEGEG